MVGDGATGQGSAGEHRDGGEVERERPLHPGAECHERGEHDQQDIHHEDDVERAPVGRFRGIGRWAVGRTEPRQPGRWAWAFGLGRTDRGRWQRIGWLHAPA